MSAYFGLDLGASSIKVCKATPMGKQYLLEAVGIAQNSVGSIDLSEKSNAQKLSDTVKGLLKEVDVKDRRVVVSVPESQVFSRVVEMPVMSDAELSSAIQWEAEQFVPIPIEEVEMDFSVVRRPIKGSTDEKMLVYLVASRKKYLQEYVDFLVALGLEPIAIESETASTARSLLPMVQEGVSLILHIGAMSSSITILTGGAVSFSYSMPTGGVALSRALAQSLSLSLPQAEQYKRTYGLDSKQLEGKVRAALLVVFSSIVSETRKATQNYIASGGSPLNRIILSGGGAYLPDLSMYMSGEFPGVEAVIADPFLTAKAKKEVVIPEERAVYSVVVGLALRSF